MTTSEGAVKFSLKLLTLKQRPYDDEKPCASNSELFLEASHYYHH